MTVPFKRLLVAGLLAAVPGASFANETAHYEFENSAADTSGSHLDGTANGPVSYSAGVCGAAATFTGGSVAIPAQNLGNYTISAWFKQSQYTGTWARIWDFGSYFGGGGATFLAVNDGRDGDQLGVGTHANGGAFVSEAGTNVHPTVGQWYHVAVTYDRTGTGMSVYVNGVLAGSSAVTGQSFVDFDDNSWLIAASNWPDPAFFGQIDEVRIYDNALGATQVKSLFKAPCAIQDGDVDDDGVPDATDLCWGNDALGDADGDGNCADTDKCKGDDASGDTDGDGVCDSQDNCKKIANPTQADKDANGFGDACDFPVSYVLNTQGQLTCTSSTGAVVTETATIKLAVSYQSGVPADYSYSYPGYYTYSGWSNFKETVSVSSPTLGNLPSHDVTSNTAQAVHYEGYYADYGDNLTLQLTGAQSWTDLYSYYNFYSSGGSTDGVSLPLPSAFPSNYAYLSGSFSSGDYSCTLNSEYVSITVAPVDADNDGVPDTSDKCPGFDDKVDTDADGQPDGCDACPKDAANDADADGICESQDNCDVVANANQSNSDGDQYGDACEPDNDNDTIVDDFDNCPMDKNANQADFDKDGVGDVCDKDVDGDKVVDGLDVCLGTPVGTAVLANGCSVAQSCVCGTAWKNHGAYVSCVSKAAETLAKEGKISAVQKGALSSAAGQSTCGGK